MLCNCFRDISPLINPLNALPFTIGEAMHAFHSLLTPYNNYVKVKSKEIHTSMGIFYARRLYRLY